jgi:AraC-like DNA-binding protein
VPDADPLIDLARLVCRHARPDLTTRIDGLLLSSITSTAPDYSLTEPLLVVMVQGRKRLWLADEQYEYGPGQCLVVTADLPVTGQFRGATPDRPALGVGLALHPATIAQLLLELPPQRRRPTIALPALATGRLDPQLLDAVRRLVRLLDAPADASVLAPLVEREILWRLLTGPQSATVRAIGAADSPLTHIGRTIGWIRANYAAPMQISDLAELAGLSPSAFHRHFRAITRMSPLQFQKRIRLQQARTLLLARAGDVAGVGHLVGYDSPTQFNREYRRMFGAPPGEDSARLRRVTATNPVRPFP